MTKLSAEAYAIVEGRHSDPFRYLGLHTEGDKTVVRAFLPEASKVDAIDEHGEAASLARIHDAGLFAGALPNGSRRYQLRARFGEAARVRALADLDPGPIVDRIEAALAAVARPRRAALDTSA